MKLYTSPTSRVRFVTTYINILSGPSSTPEPTSLNNIVGNKLQLTNDRLGADQPSISFDTSDDSQSTWESIW